MTQAFEDAFTTIERRVKALVALDIATLNRVGLQTALDQISRV